jgi:hypothetical protein
MINQLIDTFDFYLKFATFQCQQVGNFDSFNNYSSYELL